MASALLVNEQHAHWDVLAPTPSAIAELGGQVAQRAGSVSGAFHSGEWSIQPLFSFAGSPFEYQLVITHAVRLSASKSSLSERNNPRNAQLALDQIRALHRKQEARRREQAEAEWIATNRRHYTGRWVALFGGDLIAVGDSARSVAEAAAKAPSTPLITYLNDELPFAGW